ncbi:hypothetical protein [Permianibacter aggregans]|uniref:Acetyltransferase (GNAT) family protein n=1 Tax=Permianibacter aggregans TaxID=1510150 RepID=A0A4R6UGZ9_9GAMM|nr:hypothetical protein [Permianibacter aggregans]QGX41141.1 hypothetical protein E2H98_16285 [Permianibacter aggregans]TDQ44549.1 hypothetical protein EV696_12431 [Permianibacter aggregans]
MDALLPRHSVIVRQVAPVRAEQIPALTDLLSRAFFHDPLMQYFEPEPGRRAAISRILYGTVLRYTMKYGRADMSVDGNGVACWLMPSHSKIALSRIVRSGFWKMGISASLSTLAKFHAYEKASNQLRAMVCDKPSWFLWALGVDAGNRRQGISKHLFRTVTDRTDRAGEPVYVESANPNTIALLQHSGFSVVQKLALSEQLVLHGLLRAPGSATPAKVARRVEAASVI